MLLSCKKAADGVADVEGLVDAKALRWSTTSSGRTAGRLTAVLLLVSCEGGPCTTDTGRIGGTAEVGRSGTPDTCCWIAEVEVLLEIVAEGGNWTQPAQSLFANQLVSLFFTVF